jgi:hypothetical protein
LEGEVLTLSRQQLDSKPTFEEAGDVTMYFQHGQVDENTTPTAADEPAPFDLPDKLNNVDSIDTLAALIAGELLLWITHKRQTKEISKQLLQDAIDKLFGFRAGRLIDGNGDVKKEILYALENMCKGIVKPVKKRVSQVDVCRQMRNLCTVERMDAPNSLHAVYSELSGASGFDDILLQVHPRIQNIAACAKDAYFCKVYEKVFGYNQGDVLNTLEENPQMVLPHRAEVCFPVALDATAAIQTIESMLNHCALPVVLRDGTQPKNISARFKNANYRGVFEKLLLFLVGTEKPTKSKDLETLMGIYSETDLSKVAVLEGDMLDLFGKLGEMFELDPVAALREPTFAIPTNEAWFGASKYCMHLFLPKTQILKEKDAQNMVGCCAQKDLAMQYSQRPEGYEVVTEVLLTTVKEAVERTKQESSASRIKKRTFKDLRPHLAIGTVKSENLATEALLERAATMYSETTEEGDWPLFFYKLLRRCAVRRSEDTATLEKFYNSIMEKNVELVGETPAERDTRYKNMAEDIKEVLTKSGSIFSDGSSTMTLSKKLECLCIYLNNECNEKPTSISNVYGCVSTPNPLKK